MHTLLFRYESLAAESHEAALAGFRLVVYTWAKDKRCDKICDIFGPDVGVSCPLMCQSSTAFEINISYEDERRALTPISSKDLAIALGLNPDEWTIWTKLR
jgi:hypothetical protein